MTDDARGGDPGSYRTAPGDLPLTVGVTTRNRPAALARCLESVAHLSGLLATVIVFDDASDPPVSVEALPRLPARVGDAIRVLRADRPTGQQSGRNAIVGAAPTEWVLLLDDDAFLLNRSSIERGLRILEGDPGVGGVAFAQADASGQPWPNGMQPSTATYSCSVPSFIGFAHLVRRSQFLALGGYRSTFFYHGEEKEFCLRLLDAGHHVVYLPDARVAHVPDPSGRSQRDYLRYVIRNDCLNTLYNDPWWRLAWMLPARFARYFKMRWQSGIQDPGGAAWLLREVAACLPAVRAERRPLRASTFREWRRIRDQCPPYRGPAAPP